MMFGVLCSSSRMKQHQIADTFKLSLDSLKVENNNVDQYNAFQHELHCLPRNTSYGCCMIKQLALCQ